MLLTLTHGEPAINFSTESPDHDHEYEPIANPQLMLTVTHQVPSLSYGN